MPRRRPLRAVLAALLPALVLAASVGRASDLPGLTLQKNASGVVLTWGSGVGGPYNVFRASTRNVLLTEHNLVLTTTGHQWTDTTVTNTGRALFYVVVGQCGDGVLQAGEACDDANNADGDGCSAICGAERCGNGGPDAGEQCDDGNRNDGDGCDRWCYVEACGNWLTQNNETCDAGGFPGRDGCPGTCHDCGLEKPAFCNDNNPCTDDACDAKSGGCLYVPNTATCSDNSLCTTGDHCLNGACVGTAVTCPDDTNVCTTASCSPATGCGQSNNSLPCDDLNACTTNDRCAAGVCGGTPLSCDDGNACTTDTCNAATGLCAHQPSSGNACSDGNPCTTGDTCSNGTCVGGASTNCDDANPCTTDSCSPVTGCTHANSSGGACSDNSACTTGDTCSNGICTGTPVTCPDDSNPCTTAACNPSTGCYQANNTSTCDDGNLCTTSDVCSGGVCGGTPKNCNDNNPCTNDSCDGRSGACTFVPSSGAACSDGNPCTTGDTCSNGSCVGGGPANCDDGNACTTDSCSPVTGCTHANSSGGACSDNSVCTTGDTCSNGICTGTAITCPDDTNPCTTAACNAVTGCYQANNSNVCDDGNPCTTSDHCSAGLCSGTAKNCSDGNPCTTDSCSPATGACNNTPASGGACDDGNPCTTGDTCQSGACLGGSPVNCDDGNACTTDSCSPVTGCTHAPAAPGTACNDNSVCTSGDACSNGICTGTPVTCPDDSNPCTTAACNAVSGCYQANNSNACDDGNLCTVSDACSAGTCAGTPKNCNDGNVCTVDSCNASTGACTNTPSSGGACNDANACTTADTCQSGACVGGAPLNCDDGNPNTVDTCNPVTGCVHT